METGNIIAPGPPVTEDDTPPINPVNGEIWRDITDGTIYIWDGAWTVKNTTPDIKNEIQIFKANIQNVDDLEARKCLKSLGKILLKLYKEQIE